MDSMAISTRLPSSRDKNDPITEYESGRDEGVTLIPAVSFVSSFPRPGAERKNAPDPGNELGICEFALRVAGYMAKEVGDGTPQPKVDDAGDLV